MESFNEGFKLKNGSTIELSDSKNAQIANVITITYPSEFEARAAFNQMKIAFRALGQLIF